MAGQFKPQEQPSATTFNILLAAVFIDVFCSCTTDPLRPSLLVSMGFDGPAVITSVLARMTAAAATSEFIFNPLCGRLSDKYGRWAFQSYPRIGWIADVEIERRRAGTYM